MEIRKIHKSGKSLIITLPKEWGFKVGDYVKLTKEGKDTHIIIKKVG